jgi:hypothetical protein
MSRRNVAFFAVRKRSPRSPWDCLLHKSEPESKFVASGAWRCGPYPGTITSRATTCRVPPQADVVPSVVFDTVLSAEVVKLADTPSARHPLLNPRNPKKTNSFFFNLNKLYLQVRYWQQSPVGARCRQSVQNPVQSVRLNAALAWPCFASSARTTRYPSA